jgi:hypothetical protein
MEYVFDDVDLYLLTLVFFTFMLLLLFLLGEIAAGGGLRCGGLPKAYHI